VKRLSSERFITGGRPDAHTVGPAATSEDSTMAIRSFAATLLVASSLAACSATQAAEPLGATCDRFQSTPIIEQSGSVPAGSDFTVVLCSNPTTGFTWADPQIGDSGVARLVDGTYHEPGSTTLPVVGAAGGQVFTLHAVAAGSTTITASYDRPWEGGTKGQWTYRLTVKVR
jgi:predicted secreted protein